MFVSEENNQCKADPTFFFTFWPFWLNMMNTRCHEKTTANLVDVPEESCDLQPQKTCGWDQFLAVPLVSFAISIDNDYGAHDVGILIIKKPLQIGDASRAKFEANKGVRHGTPGLFVTHYINLCIERFLCALMYPVR